MSKMTLKLSVLAAAVSITVCAYALSVSNDPGENFPIMSSAYYLQSFDSNQDATNIDPLPASYTKLPYFYTNCFDSGHCYSAIPRGAAVFKTPSGLGSTAHSSFPRVELEGKHQWKVGDTFTNTQTGTVYIPTEPLTSSSGDKGQIIFAQIHGTETGGSEMFKLRWNDHDLVAGVKLHYGDSESQSTLISDVAFSDKIIYTLTAVGTSSQQKLTLNISATDSSGNVRSASRTYTYPKSGWTDSSLYFKAGDYCQDDQSDGSEGVVAYSAFNVTYK